MPEPEKPYEDLREIALVNGTVYEVGWNAEGVPGTEVVRIRRWKRFGNVEVAVRLPNGSVCTRLFSHRELPQPF